MRRLVLALPAAALLLSLDRVMPAQSPPLASRVAADLDSAVRALPPRNAGRLDREGNPLNLVFVGSEERVRRALAEAGWTPVPRTIAGSLSEGLEDVWLGLPLARFPTMNDYRLLGRVQDMNWAQVVRPIASRHHFRLWRTGLRDRQGREVWWGHGDFDLSVRWIDLSHRPDPDINAERDYIAATLRASPHLERAALTPVPQVPREGRNDKGYAFRHDGRALLVVLRP